MSPNEQGKGEVDVLANFIRSVDGNHDKGAGELAELIIEEGYRKPPQDSSHDGGDEVEALKKDLIQCPLIYIESSEDMDFLVEIFNKFRRSSSPPQDSRGEIKWPELYLHKHDSISGYHTDEAEEGCLFCIKNKLINRCKSAFENWRNQNGS